MSVNMRIETDLKISNVIGVGICEDKKKVVVSSVDVGLQNVLGMIRATKPIINNVETYNELVEQEEEIKSKIKLVTESVCHEEDDFDPFVGVALALCYNIFGSKNKFHKFVNKIIEEQKKK